MKKILFALAAIVSMMSVTSCMARSSKETVSENREVTPFHSILVESVGSVHFTQGEDFSLRMEGDKELIAKMTSYVKDETLYIDTQKGKKIRGNVKLDIYITAPTLEKVDFDGVGSFSCKEPLKAEDICFEIDGVGKVSIDDLQCRSLNLNFDGVGKADIHVRCEQLKADIDGVGKVTLSGSAGQADIRKDGIGFFNTKNLKVGQQ